LVTKNQVLTLTAKNYFENGCLSLQEKDLYQEAEPIVASGITAALQLATRKGFFEEGKPCACIHVQWNLFIMDTLGLTISGSFLLLYRGFPLSEIKMY